MTSCGSMSNGCQERHAPDEDSIGSVEDDTRLGPVMRVRDSSDLELATQELRSARYAVPFLQSMIGCSRPSAAKTYDPKTPSTNRKE